MLGMLPHFQAMIERTLQQQVDTKVGILVAQQATQLRAELPVQAVAAPTLTPAATLAPEGQEQQHPVEVVSAVAEIL